MEIRSPFEIGQLIRSRREARGLTQAEFAAKLGASRKWVMDIEHGKTTAEIGRILQALAALDVRLFVDTPSPVSNKAGAVDDIPDVDDILAAYGRVTR